MVQKAFLLWKEHNCSTGYRQEYNSIFVWDIYIKKIRKFSNLLSKNAEVEAIHFIYSVPEEDIKLYE